jgi:hypothetical protein
VRRLRFSCAALAAFFAIFARAASADTSTVGAPGIRSIVEWNDPFWQGSVFTANYQDRENQHASVRELDLGVGYGWDTGVAVSALIPVVLGDTGPLVAGANTPRIAGGLSERLRLNGAFRFWGDAYDFLAIQVGVGLPYQSDGAIQNNRIDSWNFPIMLFGRIDGSWIAFELSITDNITAPAAVDNRAGDEFYEDGTNVVLASVAVRFYPTRFIAPFVQFNETFPSALDTANNDRVNAYITDISQSPHGHAATVGLNVAPFRTGVVLGLSAEYFIPVDGSPESQYLIAGGVRWVF